MYCDLVFDFSEGNWINSKTSLAVKSKVCFYECYAVFTNPPFTDDSNFEVLLESGVGGRIYAILGFIITEYITMGLLGLILIRVSICICPSVIFYSGI
jgi:hypothetical protein